ncbi:aminoacyl tRNA synthase complex-interacting multifunctional protein 2-like [Limulus polyphemus]|uniref:Aminoacyl tRNA synthase complex-interacting multifunctional protein 2 n=1 Tax=Limulus polyphemus TaxID=6850 RepID=A0ABM1BFU2_LIMPO|nr:aminoacyl tRNA synthase complex-interacting multifunctional protein 2-like [Limulus polyphemus]
MALNGPCGMYRLEPVYNHGMKAELPTCMYKMTSIYEENNGTSKESSIYKELEDRQIEILKRLEQLKAEVEKLKVNTQPMKATAPAATTNLTNRECGVIEQLQANIGLENQVCVVKDIVITASPNYPPVSVWIMRNLLGQKIKVKLSTHLHSSLTNFPPKIRSLEDAVTDSDRNDCQLVITVIWKDVEKDPELMVNPIKQSSILGEVNIVRYLGRFVTPGYDDGDPITATEIDFFLEVIHSSFINGNNKEKQGVLKTANVKLGKQTFLVGSELTIADIMLWSVIVQNKMEHDLPSNVKKWFKSLCNNVIFSNLPEAFYS